MASRLEQTPSMGNAVDDTDPPPPYEELEQLTSTIPPLDPDASPGKSRGATVTRDRCIVHLKLLAALADLRDSISNDNALFGLDDSRADHFVTDLIINRARALVREKRWAVYTARAVDRFTVWLRTCIPKTGPVPTVEGLYHTFPNVRLDWSQKTMPPLGELSR